MPINCRFSSVIFALLVLVFACGSPPVSEPPKADGGSSAEGANEENRDEPSFTLVVSDAGGARAADESKEPRPTIATGTPLSTEQTERLLARAPDLAAKSRDVKDWALRENSQPPPRTGETLAVPFPPPNQLDPTEPPGSTTGAPLEVVRHSPDGDVPVAPSVQVTFSLPMVSVQDAAKGARGVPLAIDPSPPGQWEWIGTKTAIFRSGQRLPAATHYTVTIPAATKSATGTPLGQAVSFQFTTPTVQVVTDSFDARSPIALSPLLFVRFNQRVDDASIAKKAYIAEGSERRPLRLATPDEISNDEAIERLVSEAKSSGHGDGFVVLRPVGTLPAAAKLALVFEKGLPSAEGPLVTEQPIRLPFETRGAFEVTSHECGSGDCSPESWWQIELSNPIDADAFDESLIRILPTVSEFTAHAYGNRLVIRADAKPQRRYTVTLPSTLEDRFGQRLGREATLDFDVGSYPPQLIAKGGMIILDPAKARPTYDIRTVNLSNFTVEVFRVEPSDYEAFSNRWRGRTPKPLGTSVFNATINPVGDQDTWLESPIDLSSALNTAGLGHALVRVEYQLPNWQRPTNVEAWVQVTKLGLAAVSDDEELVVWTTQLADGEPLADVEVTVALARGGEERKASSNAQGLALVRPGLGPRAQPNTRVVAKRGDDVAFLPGGGGYNRAGTVSPTWFVTTDRGLYRPGEAVHFKGWIRDVSTKKGGGVTPLRSPLEKVTYRVFDSQRNEIAKGNATRDALGGLNASFTLPKTPNLGSAAIVLDATLRDGTTANTSASFSIQEFRRPEYEVKVTATEGPYFIGGSAEATASAKYYSGGPLVAASVSWVVSWSDGTFVPPGWSGFHFGRKWTPWGRFEFGGLGGFGGSRGFPQERPNDNVQRLEGLTDGGGSHSIDLRFPRANPAFPTVVKTEASVEDLNRQSWSAQKDLLIHPGDVYVGVKTDAFFVHTGEALSVDLAAVDLDGEAVAGRPITVDADRITWTGSGAKRAQKRETLQSCKRTSATLPVNCALTFDQGGNYELWVTTVDDDGRKNQSVATVWVAARERVASEDLEGGQVRLIPDKTEYAPGETAEILAIAPFAGAKGLLVVERSGIVSYERFDVTGTTTTLRVPITAALMPGVSLRVELAGSRPRTSATAGADASTPKKHAEEPAFASGSLNLGVTTKSRALSIDVSPQQKKLEPGETTKVDLVVTDSSGAPAVGVDTAVIIVDEAVLALDDFKTPNPLATFYPARAPGTAALQNRVWVVLAEPDQRVGNDKEEEGSFGGNNIMFDMASSESAPMAPGTMHAKRSMGIKMRGAANFGAQPEAASPIAIRTNFNALALFAPAIPTDAQGRASVRVTLPDNLTRYRVMVLAADATNRFGHGESTITARKRISVRPSPPRFLNFGDRANVPVLVQNQTDAPLDVDVAMRATNLTLDSASAHGRRVRVPANDRVALSFPTAAAAPGTARIQVVAAAGTSTDASEQSLPVWTPATTEAFATYGVIDEGAIRQPVQAPPEAIKDVGGLSVTTSSTQLQALTDAFVYLVEYPYECGEQIASRILSIAALRDVLHAFDAKGLPDAAELNKIVQRDIKKLEALQSGDGGFRWWTSSRESSPFVSVHVTHALARAQAKGYDVPKPVITRALKYLRTIRSRFPDWYGKQTRWSIESYALNVRAQIDESDTSAATGLIREAGLEGLGIENLGWLFPVLASPKTANAADAKNLDNVERYLNNQVVQTAAAAHWTTRTSDDDYLILASSRRADAILLEDLVRFEPKSPLIPKVVRGLLAHRVRGRWGNTQENVFVLLALDAYFRKFEGVTPNFVARVWLGDRYAGEHRFRGRATERSQTDVPMSALVAAKATQDLIVQKRGEGRLYYRLAMDYAPEDLDLKPLDRGFEVIRTYESIDDPDDVSRAPDGTWQFKAGARVRVRLSMVARSRRYHVALVDPVPAGLEPINPDLAVSASIPKDDNAANPSTPFWWWRWTWYDHQNLRDERAEAFASLLPGGVHEYTYVARATTTGEYIVPPAKAEEMYTPETFGRSETARVRVVD